MKEQHYMGDGCIGAKVVPFARHDRVRLRARWVVEHAERVGTATIQDDDFPRGLELRNESCALCGGFFAPHGEVGFFYSGTDGSPNEGTPWFIHPGCRAEARNWADLPPSDEAAVVHWRPVLVTP